MKVQEKYAQTDVVAFWARFACSGLQRAEWLMLERYAPPPPARVLDLGCGAGRVSLALDPLGYDVVGLDITAAMVGAARRTCAGGRFVQADLRELPFACGSFPLALVFIAALQHVAGRARRRCAFQQIARVLRHDGVLLLALDNVAPALGCYASWIWQRVRGATGVRRRAWGVEWEGKSSAPIPPTPPPPAGEGTTPPPASRAPQSARDIPSTSAHNAERAASGRGGDGQADELLASNRTRTGALGWHARGMARSLRWRTWEGLRDRARLVRLLGGERGDTLIEQVSLLPTEGKVYYHLYVHDELVADARAAGLRLLGYHSARELAEDKIFGERARRLDKQVMYAFAKCEP